MTKNNYVYPKTVSLLERNFNEKTVQLYKNLLEKINYMDKNKVYDPRLRSYQNEAISFINKRERVGIFDQQRLGKTPTCLVSLRYKDIKNKILIIAPKSTLVSWEQECNKWLPGVSVCRIDAIKHNKKLRTNLYIKDKLKIYILNYNLVMNDFDELYKSPFDCIIIDEAHRLKNFKGEMSKQSPKFTKCIVKMALKCKYRYLLTGTPSPNYAYNIYPILHILLPELYTSYFYFLDYYFIQDTVYIAKDETVSKPNGKFKIHKNIDLTQMLSMLAIQRKRKDYMQWIPDVDYKEIVLELDTKEQKLYNKLSKTYELEEYGINCQNKLTLMIALRQFTTKYSQQKTNFILDYIEDYPDEQIIVTSMFTSYLIELQKKIPGSKLCIGATNDTTRKELETNFNKKEYNVLLANIDVIKEGTKLEQCNTIIIVDPSLTYTDNEQLQDRIIPTTKEVANEKEKQQIIRLITKNTIDEYIEAMLKQKKSSTEIINNFNRKEKP